MDDIIKKFKDEYKRRAIVLDLLDNGASADLMSSWFGKVSFCSSSEEWPMQNGQPMHALAQINLTQFPFKPEELSDIEFITVFIDAEDLPSNEPNGHNWVLRTYRSLSELVPLQQIDTGSDIIALPMSPRVVEEDYPCWEDVYECPKEIEDDYYDLFDNVSGFKFGGWPSLVQSNISWAPWNEHEACPGYVFQIDSTEKGNWMWGDSGVGYFGKGTAPGKENIWALEWQCY